MAGCCSIVEFEFKRFKAGDVLDNEYRAWSKEPEDKTIGEKLDEDTIALLEATAISDSDNEMGSAIQYSLVEMGIEETFSLEQIFELATNKFKEQDEAYEKAKQKPTHFMADMKEKSDTCRVLSLWSFTSHHDQWTGEYDTEINLVKVFSISDLLNVQQ